MVAPEGQTDSVSPLNFAHKRCNASTAEQVRHVFVYESTNPLWTFQQERVQAAVEDHPPPSNDRQTLQHSFHQLMGTATIRKLELVTVVKNYKA